MPRTRRALVALALALAVWAPATTSAPAAPFLEGTHEGADFLIGMPEQWNGAAGRGLELLATRLGVDERLHRRHQHRQVLRPPAGHREGDRAGLHGGHSPARWERADHVRARERSAPQDPVHARSRRRPHRQAVAPLVGHHWLVPRPRDDDGGAYITETQALRSMTRSAT